MKKTFYTGLKAFCVSAMALAAVSCYDDTAVLDQLESLDQRLTKVENDLNDDIANLTALQSGLTEASESVEALQAALEELESTVGTGYQELLGKLDAFDGEVDGYIADVQEALAGLQAADAALDAKLVAELAKVAVANVEETDGKVVLTLADGSKVELSKPLANVDNNGLVTIVEDGGVKYWAVVGQDGHTGVAVGHPEHTLEFRVNAAKELEYCVNGGEWIPTGVSAPADNAAVMTDFVNGDDYVEITINDTKIVLPKYVAAAAELELSRTDFFLRYEGVKTVEVFAEGISEYYVMSKPNGWKAVVADDMLTVTAPTKAAVELGAAETEGEILLHATTEAGICKVVKLEVTAGPGLTLNVDAKGNITINNAYYGESTNMWGETSFGFSDFLFGLATPEDFLADPVKYLETYNSTWMAPNGMDIIYPSFYNFAEMGMYVEGEYETDVVKATVADAYYNYWYEELPAGTSFVVWVAPIEGEGKAVVKDLVYTEYVNVVWEVKADSVTHSDVTFSANVAGASSFIIGYVPESAYVNDWNPSTFEEYMMAPMGGAWNSFVSYGAAEALGVEIPAADMPAQFNLSDIYGETLMAGENYKVWVMPVLDNLKKLDEMNSYPEYDYYVYDYSAFDFNEHFMPYVIDVKTNDLQAGGAHAAELELDSNTFSEIYVNVTPSEGTQTVYYVWYSLEEYQMFESDDEIRAALLVDCYSPLSEAYKVSKTYVNPGTDWVLATVSIGTDGKYGEIVYETFSTKAIPSDPAITVELVSCVLDVAGKNFTVTVNVTGADKVMGYNISDNEDNLAAFPANVCKNGHKTSYYGYQMADVVDGQAVLTFAKNDYKCDYYVAGYNVTDGVVSAISEETLVVDLGIE